MQICDNCHQKDLKLKERDDTVEKLTMKIKSLENELLIRDQTIKKTSNKRRGLKSQSNSVVLGEYYRIQEELVETELENEELKHENLLKKRKLDGIENGFTRVMGQGGWGSISLLENKLIMGLVVDCRLSDYQYGMVMNTINRIFKVCPIYEDIINTYKKP